MMSFNLVVLAGNVGREPESRELEGTPVTSFTLAVDGEFVDVPHELTLPSHLGKTYTSGYVRVYLSLEYNP